jgi:MoaA/NifB/PqqE/SkfB family radical SAM enzyme
MNDPDMPFVKPRPEASWPRQQARALRRAWTRLRRDWAVGEERKRWNAELNWREFWHGRTRLRSTPRLIQVGTNWTCNLKCDFCRLTMDWTQEQMRKLAPEQREIGPRVLEIVKRLLPAAEMMVLTPLGEPLLWSGLDDLLDFHARAGSRNLALTTNGMLLGDRNCERLIRGQLTRLFCSIDSNDPEIYARMRVGGDLGRVEEGLRRLGEWKRKLATPFPRLTCNATFLQRNMPQLPSMIDWAKALGFEEISVQLMEIENPRLEEEFLGHAPGLARDCVLAALARGREIGLAVRPHPAIRNLMAAAAAGRDVAHHAYAAAAPNMPQAVKRQAASAAAPSPALISAGAGSTGQALPRDARSLAEKCHYPWHNLLIDTDGDARPCCWADISWGNLNEVAWEQAWNGPRAVGMRQAFLADRVPASCRKKHCRVDL